MKTLVYIEFFMSLRNVILTLIVLLTTTVSADLTAWYKFDDGFGTTAKDSSDNSYDGEIFNAAWAYGRMGSALIFDGSSYVEAPALNLNSNTVTISAWIKRQGDQIDWSGIVHNRAGSTVAGLHFGTDNELRYTWNGLIWNWDSGLVVPDDKWVFVALVIAPSGGTVYLHEDGITYSSPNTYANSIEEFDAPTNIGRDSQAVYPPRNFKGKIDDVRIYNSALLAADIEDIIAEGPNLVSMDDVVVYDAAVGNWSLLHTKPSPLYIDGEYDSAVTDFGAQAGATGLVGDVDGDGYDDIVSVVNESGQNRWYSGISTITPGVSDSNVAALANAGPNIVFGSASTTLATFLGDVDGDGTADAILVEEGAGNSILWSARKSIPGIGLSSNPDDTTTIIDFGTTAVGDLPLVGDFNGDGRVDICIFRPSGTWFTKMSDAAGQFGDGVDFSTGFGTTGDRPLVGDINGNGRTDAIALRDNGMGGMVWYVAFTGSNGQVAGDGSQSPGGFGKFTDTALIADISGDGLGDIGVYKTVSGQESGWYFSFTDSNGTPRADAEIFIGFGSDSSLPLIGEFGAHSCPYALAGDLDSDCDVDFVDFTMTAQNWLVDPLEAVTGDLDNDRDVDFADLAITSENWLEDCINAPDDAPCEQPVRDDRQRTYLVFDLNLQPVSQADSDVAIIKSILSPQNRNSERIYAFAFPIIPLNMSVSEMQDVINTCFDVAEKYEVPVFFPCDYMYGILASDGGASPKWHEEPSMCEWTDFPAEGETYGPIPRQWFNWGDWLSTLAIPCFESPAFKPFIINQYQQGIVNSINIRLEQLRAEDKEYLFAGFSVGWETHVPDQRPAYNNGTPPGSEPWELNITGYAALHYLGWDDDSLTAEAASRGISKSKLIRDLLHQVSQDYMEMFAKIGWESGIEKDKMFTHIVPMESVSYGENYYTTNVPPIWVSVNDYSIPGFTMNPYSAATYNMSNLKAMIAAADPTQNKIASCESYFSGAGLSTYSGFKWFLDDLSDNAATLIDFKDGGHYMCTGSYTAGQINAINDWLAEGAAP